MRNNMIVCFQMTTQRVIAEGGTPPPVRRGATVYVSGVRRRRGDTGSRMPESFGTSLAGKFTFPSSISSYFEVFRLISGYFGLFRLISR